MSEPIALALIGAIPAFLGVALTAVLHYGRQSVRDVVDAQKEMIGLVTSQRDEYRDLCHSKDETIADLAGQIRGLEAKVGHYERRPTRGGSA